MHCNGSIGIKKYFFILSVSLLAAFIIYFFIKDYGFIDYQKNLSTYNKLHVEKHALLEELATIKSETELLKKNEYYIEKKLREDMFLIKPNEKIIIFD